MILIGGALTAGAHQPKPDGGDLPGFFTGVLHGVTVVFSLIGSITSGSRPPEVRYCPNSGGWYDLGYVLGVGAFFGSAGAGSQA
jgi:hypothetical protein